MQVRLLFRLELELEQTALGSCVSSMVLKLWIGYGLSSCVCVWGVALVCVCGGGGEPGTYCMCMPGRVCVADSFPFAHY